MREVLPHQADLIQAILDRLDTGVILVDAQGKVVLWNEPAQQLFGSDLSCNVLHLYQSEQLVPVVENPLELCARGVAFGDEERYVLQPDSPRGSWVQLSGKPLFQADGSRRGGLLFCHDITQRKRAERILKAQYDVARVLADGVSVTETARRVLRVLCEALSQPLGVLWLANADQSAVKLLESWHRPSHAFEPFLAVTRQASLGEAEFPLESLRKGEVAATSMREPRWRPSARAREALRVGLTQLVAFPIEGRQGAGGVVGVVEFWSASANEVDSRLEPMMRALGSQIGQFIERQRIERELRDSQALYESLVENLPQNIFRKDRESRVTYANQRYCQTLKLPPEKLLGLTDYDLFPPELAEKYVTDDKHIMQTGQILDTEEQHHTVDGQTIYVHVVKSPVYDARRNIVGVQGIFWDDTERVHANQATARSERRYRQLTEATLDAIVVLDERGRVVLFNPAAERMFGYTREEILGEHASVLLPEPFGAIDEQGVSGLLHTTLASYIGSPRELTARHKGGTELPVEIALSELTDDQPGAQENAGRVLAAVRDLTERNKMRAVLIQNEKLASIGLLSAGVAHEINNPLAFVANNLVVLERDIKGLLRVVSLYEKADPVLEQAAPPLLADIQELSEEIDLPYIRDNLERILNRTRDGVDRVTRIVHSLRGMARTEPPRRQTIRLPDLINNTLEIMHGRFKSLGVNVEQHHDPDPMVSCVSTQISQVLLNLLVNAYQAIESARRSDGQIVIRTRRLRDTMLLEISDNGCGIHPDHLSRLFDPFFTTKDVGEGTGLGLSISHHIVTAHGGRIEVESEFGCGTTFRIFLPLRDFKESP